MSQVQLHVVAAGLLLSRNNPASLVLRRSVTAQLESGCPTEGIVHAG